MKKINRLLAILLAFAVVITTFSSDLTTARVFATEEETVIDSEDKINTVEKEEIPVVSEASTEESTEEVAEPAEGEGTGAVKEDEILDEDASATGADIEGTVPAVVEEAEEEEEEEEAEEAKILYAYESGIKITLKADPGVLPEDAELRVSAIEDTDEVKVSEEEVKDAIDEVVEEEVTATYSFDINIYSESKGDPEDNGYVQPNTDKGDITITFDNIDEAKDEDVSLSVFYVNEKEDGEISVEEVAKGSKDSIDDAITFAPEHFSVYSVVLKTSGRNGSSKSFDLKQVDVKLNEINKTSGGKVPVEMNKDIVTADEIKNQISKSTPAGYSLIGIYAIGGGGSKYVVSEFSYDGNKISYKAQDGRNHDAQNAKGIYAVYRTNDQKTTSHHLDLGFEKADFDKYNNVNTTVEVQIGTGEFKTMSIDKKVYQDKYEGKDYYEFRYTSDTPISINSTITFKVTVKEPGPGNKKTSYSMTCDAAKNAEAFERCFKAHYAEQKDFGFDYVSNLTKDFVETFTVNYHSNFGDDPETIVATENPAWTAQTPTQKYTYMSTYPTDKAKKPNATFDGWGKKDREGKVVKITGSTIDVTKGSTTDLYAIWKDNKIPVAVYATDGTDHPSVNSYLAKTLGLTYVQTDHYYPIGVVYLPADLFKGKDNNYIRSVNDWNTVKTALSGATKQYNTENKNNTVFDNLKYVQADTNNGQGYGEGSLHTALFKWDRSEQANAITNPAGGNFKYHLDLRFATNVIEYEARYFENSTHMGTSTLSALETAYLKDPDKGNKSVATLPTSDAMQAYKTHDRVEYAFDGFYTVAHPNNIGSKINSGTVELPDSNAKYKVIAKYVKVVKCTVTYTDGVDGEVVFADQVNADVLKGADTPKFETTNQNGEPTLTGYKFKGWKSSLTGETLKEVAPKVTDNVTYTAQWEADFSKYIVQYYKQNAEDGLYPDTPVKTLTYDKAKKTGEVAAYSKDVAYILKGDEIASGFAYDETEANVNGDSYSKITNDNEIKVRADGKLIIKVYFKRNTYKVTYKYDKQKGKVTGIKPEKEPVDNTEYRYGQTVTVNSTEVTATGYDFDDWYLGEEPVSTFKITEATELIGKFTPKKDIKYAIKYFQQNAEDDLYTEVTADQLNRTGNYTENVRYEPADRSNRKYVGFEYAKTKVVLKGASPVEYGKNAIIPAIAVPAEDDKLVIEVYYNRKEYEVTYKYEKYNGENIPEIVDPTEAELVKYSKKYRFGQTVTIAEDSKAPGYTFKGWKARLVSNDEETSQETTTVSAAAPSSIPGFLLFIPRLLAGEDETQTTATTFKMPASDVNVVGSFEKTPYQISFELKGNGGGKGFDYEKVYNATEQSADIDFELIIYMEGSAEPLTALNVNSANYETLMASLDKAMSLGTLTVYAAEGGELFENLGSVDPSIAYTGEEQDIAKSVTKTITVDGREYSVTVDLAGGKGRDVDDYNIYVKHISFKLGDQDITEKGIFETDLAVGTPVGKLTITPATLTIKADDKYKAYGASDPQFTASISDLLGTDVASAKVVSDFFKNYYSFSREPGNSAGGKYAIHVTLPEELFTIAIPVQPMDRSNEIIAVRNLSEVFTDDDAIVNVLRNYRPAFVDGTLTIGTTGGGDDDDDNPTTVEETPVAAAPAPAVLGAQRAVPAEQPAVLGARRAGTSDTSILGSIITIIVAAAIAFSMVFIKRKKNEEQ